MNSFFYKYGKWIKYYLVKKAVLSSRVENICLIHFGRCGSTVLSNMLNQHEDIRWHGEIYSEYLKKQIPEVRMTTHPGDILKLRMGLYPSKYFGFEIKAFGVADLGPKVLNSSFSNYYTELTKRRFSKYIVLKRENFLRQIISIQIGLETKQMHLQNNKKSELKQIILNPKNVVIGFEKMNLIAAFQLYEQAYIDIHNVLVDEDILDISYEHDIAPSPLIGYRKICNYLSVSKESVKINLSPTNPYSLQEMLINYAEIEDVLAGTKYASFLDENKT